MENKKSTLLTVLLVVLGVLVIAGGIYGVYYFINKKESSQSEKTNKTADCSTLDVSSWKSYTEGYTIKYPSNWSYKKETSERGKTKWYVSFAPKDKETAIWVGGVAASLEDFKKELVSELPSYAIVKTESATIDKQQGTKITLSRSNVSYKSYAYYMPFLNVPYVFLGPADNGTELKNCEAEIFAKMIENFKFPTTPGGSGTSESGLESYNNLDYRFSFDYSSNWEVKDVYIYETPAGEKATVPTIILGKKSDPKNAATNQILINLRQGACMTDTATKSTETAGTATMTIYKFQGENNWCAQASVNGQDQNGKSVPYEFVAKYTDSAVKDVFKDVIKSFEVIK